MATYEQLQAMSQQAANRALRNYPSGGGNDFWAPFRNMISWKAQMHDANEDRRKRNEWEEMMKRNPYGGGNDGQNLPPVSGQGQTIIDRFGWQGGSPQAQNPTGVDLSGLGNASNSGVSVGAYSQAPQQNSWGKLFNFNNPTSDNPQAQAEVGQGFSPNQAPLLSSYQMTPQQKQEWNDKMNLRQFIEWDAKMNGVTNPLVSAQRYQIFVEPLKKQAEVQDLRNAYLTLQNPKSTDEEKMNAIALIEYDKKNPYMNEDHDMNVERFNWAKQNFNNQQALFPYQLQNAQLGVQSRQLGIQGQQQNLENNAYNMALKNLELLGEYGTQNFEGSKWNRKEGVDLNNMQPQSIAGLNHAADIYYQLTGEPLFVTSGRDSNVHAGGKFSHYNGYKVDVATDKLEKDPALRQAFINECAKHGIIIGDEYTHPSPGSTGGHLDIQFAGYRNNYAGKKNGKKPEMSYDDMVAIDKAKAAFTENPNAETSKPIAMAFGRYYRDLALAVGGEQAKRQIYSELKKMFPDATPDMIELLTNGAVNAGVQGWINKTDGQTTKTDSTPKPTEKNDPVDGLTYDDNYSGGYNIGGVRTSESMHNKIANIQPYEKTLQEQRENFEAQRNAAENRQRYNEEEQSRLYDELEREFGI